MSFTEFLKTNPLTTARKYKTVEDCMQGARDFMEEEKSSTIEDNVRRYTLFSITGYFSNNFEMFSEEQVSEILSYPPFLENLERHINALFRACIKANKPLPVNSKNWFKPKVGKSDLMERYFSLIKDDDTLVGKINSVNPVIVKEYAFNHPDATPHIKKLVLKQDLSNISYIRNLTSDIAIKCFNEHIIPEHFLLNHRKHVKDFEVVENYLVNRFVNEIVKEQHTILSALEKNQQILYPHNNDEVLKSLLKRINNMPPLFIERLYTTDANLFNTIFSARVSKGNINKLESNLLQHYTTTYFYNHHSTNIQEENYGFAKYVYENHKDMLLMPVTEHLGFIPVKSELFVYLLRVNHNQMLEQFSHLAKQLDPLEQEVCVNKLFNYLKKDRVFSLPDYAVNFSGELLEKYTEAYRKDMGQEILGELDKIILTKKLNRDLGENSNLGKKFKV